MNPTPTILHESPWTLAVNKPAGLLVERSRHGYSSVEEWAWEYVSTQTGKNFVGIVHRLDRPVSGALLLAKRIGTLKELNRQFRERTVEKNYRALVEHPPARDQDRLTHWLRKDQREKKALVFTEKQPDTAECLLDYQVLDKRTESCLLEITLHTGKYHQIRAQLAAIGCPVIGDEKYGSPLPYRPEAIALHARQLVFTDPYDGERKTVTAPPPEDEWWAPYL